MRKYISALLILGVMLVLIPYSQTEASICTQKAFDSPNSNAYGVLVRSDNNTLLYFYNSWTGYEENSNDTWEIAKRTYDIASGNWSNESVVYSHPDYILHLSGGGELRNRICLFLSLYDKGTGDLAGVGYILSEGFTGDVWSVLYPLFPALDVSYPYGPIAPSGEPHSYLTTAYRVLGDEWVLELIQTTNNGNTWQRIKTLYSGKNCYTETAICNVGGSCLIILARNTKSSLHQAVSEDGGKRWTSLMPTNLGSIVGEKIPWAIYNEASGNVTVAYHDRGDGYTRISQICANMVTDNITSWQEPLVISPHYNAAGYPSLVALSPSEYFVVISIKEGGKFNIWQSIVKYDGIDNVSIDAIPYIPPAPQPSDSSRKAVVSGGGGSGGGGGVGYTYIREDITKQGEVIKDIVAKSGDKQVSLEIDRSTTALNYTGRIFTSIIITEKKHSDPVTSTGDKVFNIYDFKPNRATLSPGATLNFKNETGESLAIVMWDPGTKEWVQFDSIEGQSSVSATIIQLATYGLTKKAYTFPVWTLGEFAIEYGISEAEALRLVELVISSPDDGELTAMRDIDRQALAWLCSLISEVTE